MANFTVTYYKAWIAGFMFIICITSVANASGNTETSNAAKEYARENAFQYSNSGQHTIYCNGTWCVKNEEYCDKNENKCLRCQYMKPDCTPYLDCLQYCIEKGVEQAILESAGTVTEENSTPAWALPLFIVFLLLFLVSFVGHIVVFFVWFLRRQKGPKQSGTPAEVTPLAEQGGTDDQTEPNTTQQGGTDDQTEPNTTQEEQTMQKPVQEQSKRSDKESHEFTK